MRISIITAVRNRADTIRSAIESLQAQTHTELEHIVMDAVSTDGTLDIVKRFSDARTAVHSAPDDGIYDALNKGKSRATGDVVGVLHSDDFLADPHALRRVAGAFDDPRVDAVYGDLHYVSKDNPDRVVRNWRSGAFRPEALRWGWMPPHPALFLRRRVIEQHGLYDTSFRIAADYDAILRYFSQPGFRAVYVPQVFVKMRVGGESNRSLERILLKSREDYRALRKNNVGGVATLLSKNARKATQFLR
ncbi:MAG: glycosyltransferase family 2 protein [Paracoccaceae bacterium]|nr:glycosyltransferase family 2 protein [Paracoccaceae bacterium]